MEIKLRAKLKKTKRRRKNDDEERETLNSAHTEGSCQIKNSHKNVNDDHTNPHTTTTKVSHRWQTLNKREAKKIKRKEEKKERKSLIKIYFCLLIYFLNISISFSQTQCLYCIRIYSDMFWYLLSSMFISIKKYMHLNFFSDFLTTNRSVDVDRSTSSVDD